jgi:hypothetical protein
MRVRPDDVGGGGGGMHGEILHPRPCNQHLEGGKVYLYQSLGLRRGRGGKGTSSLSEEEEEELSDDDEVESGADESEM